MIFSYNWLREYVDLPDNPADLAGIMTFGGIEVEDYHPFAEKLQDIIIVKIKEVKKHPSADKLFLCLIETGSAVKQVVCGAPNCSKDMLTAYAPVGMKLGNSCIDRINIRGIDSEGMLCSEKDLALSDDHSGIMSLPQSAAVGGNLRDFLKLNDTVFEIEVTPNRPDLLGLLGIARDVAALTVKSLHLPADFPTDGYNYPEGVTAEQSSDSSSFKLINEAPDLCTRYIARVIKGVRIGESPHWLKQKLLAADVNPVNNLVDITNYVMLEFGHPLHAFDYDLLSGKEIRIRKADRGEHISALDQRSYNLEDTDLVIADKENPVALAGIIGGKKSSITTVTENIVLEAANFYHLSIRNTSGRLKVATDSSYRFERNLSDETVNLISQRAAKLICEICGGEVIHLIDSYPSPEKERIVDLRPSRANELLTTNFTAQSVTTALDKLGIRQVKKKDDTAEKIDKQVLSFLIPSYRKDLRREIDLIEELIRLHGYNNIPEKPEKRSLTDLQWFRVKRKLADYLVNNGFFEAINSSFSETFIIKQLNLPQDDFRSDHFTLINPLGASFSMMRTTLVPGLLKNVQFNLHNGQHDIKLFELGKVYLKNTGTADSPNSVSNYSAGKTLSVEKYFLTGVVSGNIKSHHWKYKPERTSIFSVKGYVEGLLNLLTDNRVEFHPVDINYYQKGSCMKITLDGKKIGDLGKLDPLLAGKIEIEQDVFVFDIDISKVRHYGEKETPVYQEINKYPPVARDISFVVANHHKHKDLVKTIQDTDKNIINNIRLIDVFTGKNIPEGHRSLTYNILFSSREGTLTDEKVNQLLEKILDRLKNNYKIEMR